MEQVRMFLKLFTTLLIVTILNLTSVAQDVYVKGYLRKDGSYVGGHYRTPPNSNFYDNYSTLGNINPYTLKDGWKTEKYYAQYLTNNTPYVPKAIDWNKFDNLVVSGKYEDLKRLLDYDVDVQRFILAISYFLNDEGDAAISVLNKNISTSKSLKIKNASIEALNSIKTELAMREFRKLNLDVKDLNLLNLLESEKRLMYLKYLSIKEEYNFGLKYYFLFNYYITLKDYDNSLKSLSLLNSLEKNGLFDMHLEGFEDDLNCTKLKWDLEQRGVYYIGIQELYNNFGLLIKDSSSIENLFKDHGYTANETEINRKTCEVLSDFIELSSLKYSKTDIDNNVICELVLLTTHQAQLDFLKSDVVNYDSFIYFDNKSFKKGDALYVQRYKLDGFPIFIEFKELKERLYSINIIGIFKK